MTLPPHIGEPEDNRRRLVIGEARADEPPEDVEIHPGQVINGTRAIALDNACRLCALLWPTYVCYAVRHESCCTLDTKEAWQGRLCCLYSQSHVLDYVARATVASDESPGQLRHWGLNCLHHIIDVVSSSAPQVRRLRPA